MERTGGAAGEEQGLSTITWLEVEVPDPSQAQPQLAGRANLAIDVYLTGAVVSSFYAIYCTFVCYYVPVFSNAIVACIYKTVRMMMMMNQSFILTKNCNHP